MYWGTVRVRGRRSPARARTHQRSLPTIDVPSRTKSLWARHVILEVARRVGLRPQADLSLHGRTQDGVVGGNQIRIRRCVVTAGAGRAAERVFERELAIEV